MILVYFELTFVLLCRRLLRPSFFLFFLSSDK